MSVVQQEVITAGEVKTRSLIAEMADKYGLESNNMMRTLKATAFKGDVTNEQMAALLIVAKAHNLNPWTKELYAFPDKSGGIVPVVGLDGWARIVNEHPQFDGMDFEQDDEKCTCRMYRKDRGHPTVVTEYMSECKRGTGPWQTHPKRMLRHKAMIQCARIAFSFAGIFDQDEAERIVEAEPINITPREDEIEGIPEGTTPEKISPRKLRELCEGLTKATENNDSATVFKLYDPLTSAQRLFLWNNLRSWERSAIKRLYAEQQKADAGMQLDAWSMSLARVCTDDAKLTEAFKKVADAYEANGSEVPETVVLCFDECRQSMGAA